MARGKKKQKRSARVPGAKDRSRGIRKLDPLLARLARTPGPPPLLPRAGGAAAALPLPTAPSSGSLLTPLSGSWPGTLSRSPGGRRGGPPVTGAGPAPERPVRSVVVPESVDDLRLSFQGVLCGASAPAAEVLRRHGRVLAIVRTDAAHEEAQSAIQEAKALNLYRPITVDRAIIAADASTIQKLERVAGVRTIEVNWRTRPALDQAHRVTRLWDSGGAATTTLTGQGVLVGVVDTGIDVKHKSFRKAGGGGTRLVEYVDQFSRTVYSAGDIDSGLADSVADEIGHGTHVMGIAAGTGAGTGYQGVAPGADLVMVKTTFDSVMIAEGVAHIFELAKQRGQPCVINLSLGGHYGGHDGTSEMERVIDELCDESAGRVVCVSAGNEASDDTHAGGVLAAAPASGGAAPRWSATFRLMSQVQDSQLVGFLMLQVWTQFEDDVTVYLRAPNGERFAVDLVPGSPPTEDEWSRSTFKVQADRRVAEYSQDHVTTFLIATVPQPAWLEGWTIQVEPRAGGAGIQVGAIHAWIIDRQMGTFLGGAAVRSHLVGMPGTAYSAITVASFATRKAWPGLAAAIGAPDLSAINVGDISYFSSPGPTRDGQNKPDVAAPGQWLVSALSGSASSAEMPAWTHLPGTPSAAGAAALQGTSMASPYVAGAVALLLEQHPGLTWSEVRRRIIKSTVTDAFTMPCWNPRWGYGKLDVQRLLAVDP